VAAFSDSQGWYILGKPGTPERAAKQLAQLSGRQHVLITAVVVQMGEKIMRHIDTTTLTMRTLSAAEIARYIAADQPLDCAGAYKLEARGITLFNRIISDDHSAITGLPLMAVTRLLGEFGYALP
jgi:septum formation protein